MAQIVDLLRVTVHDGDYFIHIMPLDKTLSVLLFRCKVKVILKASLDVKGPHPTTTV